MGQSIQKKVVSIQLGMFRQHLLGWLGVPYSPVVFVTNKMVVILYRSNLSRPLRHQGEVAYSSWCFLCFFRAKTLVRNFKVPSQGPVFGGVSQRQPLRFSQGFCHVGMCCFGTSLHHGSSERRSSILTHDPNVSILTRANKFERQLTYLFSN